MSDNLKTSSVLWIAGLFVFLACQSGPQKAVLQLERPPGIDPDYSGTTVPVNIAPLNFVIREPGTAFRINFRGQNGVSFTVKKKSPDIRIPRKSWRRLLKQNHGGRIKIDILVRDKTGVWRQYQPVGLQVANDKIDRFLVYRLLKHPYKVMGQMGLYQRDLESFSETEILNNRNQRACFNCHSFYQYNSEKMFLHVRPKTGPAMLLDNQKHELERIDTRSSLNSSPASYSMWHPDGKRIVFSSNKVYQFFHAVGNQRDVMDIASDLFIYEIDGNQVTTSPEIASPDWMETQPAWSPDGRFLYFTRAPQIRKNGIVHDVYNTLQYDLVRVAYWPGEGRWGSVEKVISASEIGRSLSFPRLSPDGRFVAICTSPYGTFPVVYPGSDIALFDLESRKMIGTETVNSPESESYHSWSSNGRWLVFSSKRDNGFYARPYFCFVDENGKPEKPFPMPQEDPAFYGSFLWTYNVPEFINAPIEHDAIDFIERMVHLEPQIKAVGSGEMDAESETENSETTTFDP